MSSNACKHCGCNEIDEDQARGDRVCTNCGAVLEDQIIVSDLQFQENAAGGSSVIGQFVDGSGKHFSLGGGHFPGMNRESREITLQNAKRNIERIADKMQIAKTDIEPAFNYFKMALCWNYTRGRKSDHVLAACLYIVCRQKQTSHMLLDFSDCIRASVYSLGKTYKFLAEKLHVNNIQSVDPCLYMDRFAGCLEFGKKTKEVASTALRIVQRMKRDWMHQGRRPSGLCGAALLVAARMHDFNRTVKQIIRVVKVCESTIRKRLMEFEDTPSSQLTVEQFHSIDLSEEQDPPCFSEGKKKSKLLQLEEQDPSKFQKYMSEVEKLQKKIDKSLVQPSKKPVGIWAHYMKASEEKEEKDSSSRSKPEDIDAAAEFLEQETMQKILEEDSTEPDGKMRDSGEGLPNSKDKASIVGLRPTAASLGIKFVVEDCIALSDKDDGGEPETGGELDLDGIDDEELDKLLLTEEEVTLKTEIWMEENKDYLEAQRIKEEERIKQEQEQASKPEKKKKRTKKKEKVPVKEAASAAEALAQVLVQKNMSNKINYTVLDTLRDIMKPGGFRGTSTSAAPASSILKPESRGERLKRPSSFEEPEAPAKKKTVQIQEPVATAAEATEEVMTSKVVKEGPVEYKETADHEADEDDYVDEEDEEEEEGQETARSLFVGEDEEEDYGYHYDIHD